MSHVTIQVPSDLYVLLYQLFGAKTHEVIEQHLRKLVQRESPKHSLTGEGHGPTARPKPHTIGGQVWQIADELFEDTGVTPERGELLAQCIAININNNTANTQFSHWKNYQRGIGVMQTRGGNTRMRKYEPLENYLKLTGLNDLSVTFADLSKKIGIVLPESAFLHREWWSNQKDYTCRPQAKAWMSVGYMVESVNQDRDSGWVRFVRNPE